MKRRLNPPLRFVLAFSLLVLSACDRKHNPLMETPSGSVTSVTMTIPQIETKNAPFLRLFVQVRDQSNNPLNTFKPANFSILENGAAAFPTEVGAVSEGLYIVLVIDRSGSMDSETYDGSGVSRNTAATSAATDFINGLGSSDQLAIIQFDNEAVLSSDFTSSKAALISSLTTIGFGGSTAFYDGVVMAGGLLSTKQGRKFIIAMGDGDDNSSTASVTDVINAVQASGASGYTVALGADVDTTNYSLISESTDAESYTSLDGVSLSSIFLSILDKYQELIYVSYRQMQNHGTLELFLNYGTVTGHASRDY